MKKVELLAPVGDKERLITAIHFGADAVYFAGKKFGLRAFADNFDENEIIESINYAHKHNVKVYITVNILAHNDDFVGLVDYLKFLDNAKADGVIVSDLGIAHLVKKYTNLELHVSTQANVTNSESAKVWVSLGAKRLVLARELSLKEIKDIKNSVGKDIDIECFAHGAMCISYSGRCLLSNYFRGRDSNKGACAQPCRWSYVLSYKENDENDVVFLNDDNTTTYLSDLVLEKESCLFGLLFVSALACKIVKAILATAIVICTAIIVSGVVYKLIKADTNTLSQAQSIAREEERKNKRIYFLAQKQGNFLMMDLLHPMNLETAAD